MGKTLGMGIPEGFPQVFPWYGYGDWNPIPTASLKDHKRTEKIVKLLNSTRSSTRASSGADSIGHGGARAPNFYKRLGTGAP